MSQYRSEYRHFNFFFSILELLPKSSFLCRVTQLFERCYADCVTPFFNPILPSAKILRLVYNNYRTEARYNVGQLELRVH